MTEAGASTLIELEGFKTTIYPDAGGKSTIGVGHLLTAEELASESIVIDGVPCSYLNGLTVQQCRDLMEQDIGPRAADVAKLVSVPLNPNQSDALTIFAFNVGISAFGTSTLLKKLNAGAYDEVPSELSRWNKAGAVVVQGLVNRRNAEIKLWNTPV